MLNRGGLLLIGLGTAAALPYLLSPSSGIRDKVASVWPAAESHSAVHDQHLAQLHKEHEVGHISPAHAEIRGATVTHLGEVLNFDITPQSILSRWPRVSTRLSDLNLQGYRVPLVTGTGDDALAGALTYYFNREQRLERITFVGKTGDPRALVAELQSQHYSKEPTKDPAQQIYRFKQWDKTVGECLIQPARVIAATAPRSRYEINLDMRRPTPSI